MRIIWFRVSSLTRKETLPTAISQFWIFPYRSAALPDSFKQTDDGKAFPAITHPQNQEFRVGPTCRLDKWNSAWFPNSSDNVYYSGAVNNIPTNIPVYSRGNFQRDEIGIYRMPISYVKGNATINEGKPQSASVKIKK